MTNTPLAGKKIAVLVESQYIPGEIRLYRERFAAYGATVDLVSRLWGQPSLRFYSTVEPGVVDEIEWIEVDKDVATVAPEDYAAVVVSANYTSVRLRWSEREDVTAANAAEVARSVPAAHFFRRAMADPRIVKAAACHGLWLLTTSPDLLAGRKVICNKVVLADVVNAGGLYTPCVAGTPEDRQVVVDGDLVTNNSWHATEALIDAVKDAIVAGPGATAPQPLPPLPDPRGKRHVLVVLSEWGYWGEELVGPLDEFDRAGWTVDFCTPNGRRPNAIPVSMDPDFFDPALMRPVTTPAMAAKVREIDDPATAQGRRLQTPISLAAWFPDRPYYSAPSFVRLLEAYNRALAAARDSIARYDAVLIVGGSGPVVDLVNNQRVHDLILAFHDAGKPIAAECYGVACLAFARDMNIRKSIIWGKHVTGHCLEYDYKDGTAFVRARNTFLDFNMGPPPYPLEFILRDATGPDGGFHGNFGHPTSVLVDYPFITGRSTPDSTLTGRKLIEVLDGDPPLRRWGW
ncbi:type 1 glutamine amidotransferase domain-containing protein [Rhodoplanes serenus]|uniref:type 1 glutamine amidotransferase domain-containing protein n=1 Tax=Rhodoplanes serenus TaxID=200615 RepID=UPI000DADB132|nr:type 1 glutamine amidotransferase domain-containing protein [Rhodoplanes serenus]RAI36936.1 thiamine biosynthesis protein ThiJ [Rhodoplanes serenus]